MSRREATDARRLAAIDVGSNSIKMLAAERSAAGFVYLDRAHITVRLQSGLRGGALDEAALRRGEDAIAHLAERARAIGVGEIAAFGTSALRDAANADEFVRRVSARCGVPLRVISGEEEAESAYLAISPAGRALIVNPGGGSTEMVLGEDGRALCALSAHVGAVSLYRETDGFAPEAVRAAALAKIRPVWERLGAEPGLPVTASGGGASCLAAVCLGARKGIEGYYLSREAGEALYARLCGMTVDERRAMPGMEIQRADILPCGLAILLAFLECAGSDGLRVSERGNLYGFVQMMARGPAPHDK